MFTVAVASESDLLLAKLYIAMTLLLILLITIIFVIINSFIHSLLSSANVCVCQVLKSLTFKLHFSSAGTSSEYLDQVHISRS